ncbi:MAG: type I-E CRISPR-associated endoribonuclease Cas2e [Gemmatimonas sp.]|jgi:CRISPR-associated protein Cas2|uniref:type I-E CRISPR-associated endoribonuclease Cas2e n=1 Tax=Gemmatimonas sp. TaxID=1962908 RepID=UPI00391FC286
MPRVQALTVVLTRDVTGRYRGFLASVLSEVAPGVYVASNMNAGVRDRVWAVMSDWWDSVPGGSVLMVYADRQAPSGMAVRTLGTPAVNLVDVDGLHLARFTPTDAEPVA